MACAKETGNTDEKLETFCDPCQIEDEHIVAVSYCEECNEYLCKHCHKAHRRLAVSREHIVKENDLPDKSLSKGNKTETEMPEKCFAHEDQVIDYYCMSHEELCCSVCLPKSHQNCGKDVKKIADYLKEIDMEQHQRDLESKINGLVDDVNGTMVSVQKSLKVIQLTHDVAQSNMLKAKNDAFEHIEGIYSTLDKQLDKTRETDLNKVLPYRNKCQAITFDIKTLESFFKEKKKCDKYQSFLAMKKAEIKIKSNLDDLNEIKSKKILKVRRYYFKPDSGITNMKTQPVDFGSFNDVDNATKLAGPVTPLHAGDADEEKTCCITGLTVLSKTRLVIADHGNGSVKLVNTEENTILSKVKYESAPWDITCISDKQLVAVTIPEAETVHFVAVTENKTLEKLCHKHIKLNGKCYGISNSNGKIFVTVIAGQSSKLEQYDVDGTLLATVKLDARKPEYVILNEDGSKIYISDNDECSGITELSTQNMRQLNTLDSCRDEVIGMAVDKTGVLYYCDSYYREIDYVFMNKKQKGERKRINLVPKTTPHPKCLAYCNETGTLFVGKEGNNIEVYIVL